MTKRFLPGTLNPLYEGSSPFDIEIEELNNPYYVQELEKKILETELEQDLFAGISRPKAIILGPAKFSFNNPDTDYAVPVHAGTKPTKDNFHTWYHFRIPEFHAHLPDPCSPRLLKDKRAAMAAIYDHPIAPYIRPDLNVEPTQMMPGTIVEINYDRGPDVGMNLFPKIVKEIGRAYGMFNVDAECQGILNSFANAVGYDTVSDSGGGQTTTKCSSALAPRTADDIATAYGTNGVTKAKATLIVEACKKIDPNMDPGWLANAISMESSFKTNNPNKAGSGANGLIQWMPWNAAKALKYTKDGYNHDKAYSGSKSSIYKDYNKATQDKAKKKIGTLSFEQQMNLVVEYFKRRGGSTGFKSQGDVMMAIFYPAAMGKPDSFSIADDFESRGKSRAKFLEQNHGIVTRADYVNKGLKKAKLDPAC